jgi:hypothetical protein
MSTFVVDENVPIVANDRVRTIPKAPQADNACRISCVHALRHIVKSGILIIDDVGEVLDNYRRHLQHRGQPGVGDAFFKHIVDNQFNRKKVHRISVPKTNENEFESFPADPALHTFDGSDRIYVALALAAPQNSPILNAVDSDYNEHKTALEKAGVRVQELCLQCIRKYRV